MIKHLLPVRKRYFKTALHVHTDVSDGVWSPEELKAYYKEIGFSCVAFSDHNLITTHSHLNDEDFLALTAYEMAVKEPDVPSFYARIIHINVLAKTPDHLWQVYRPTQLFAKSGPWMERVEFGDMDLQYGIENINEFIARTNAEGFLCTYNHPEDPLHYRGEDMALEGLWGIEIHNHCSRRVGNLTYNDMKFQHFLMQGKRVFPIASDDCHSRKSAAGNCVMVGAETLTYEAMIDALTKGDFYATTGPEIYSLTLEDQRLHITCSEAIHIGLISHGRYMRRRPRDDVQGPITEATFNLKNWFNGIVDEWKDRAFFRLVVTDTQGRRAYTRAYWYDELLQE